MAPYKLISSLSSELPVHLLHSYFLQCHVLTAVRYCGQIMGTFKRFMFIISWININEIYGSDDSGNISKDKLELTYEGSKFPVKYLDIDTWAPTVLEFDYYIKHLKRTLGYFGRAPNSTDVNTAIGLYLAKSILKRTLMEGRSKLQPRQISELSKTINDADYILSHYIYRNLPYGWSDMEFRVSKLFQHDGSLVYSIGEYNKKRLNKWILADETIHAFIEDIDEATLSKEDFIKLGDINTDDYFINILDSDTCLSRIAYDPEPIDLSSTRRCRPNAYCNKRINSDPSIGYGLTHRMLNLFMRVNVWRCYTVSEAADLALLDRLCAAMYREAVYLARRGFFARDLFLEHIALCAMLGYEEFHRRNWFKKASSWLTDRGCMKEFRNYDINRSRLLMEGAGDDLDRRSRLMKYRCITLHSLCDDHPTALLMIVISHAIRYTVYLMNSTGLNEYIQT